MAKKIRRTTAEGGFIILDSLLAVILLSALVAAYGMLSYSAKERQAARDLFIAENSLRSSLDQLVFLHKTASNTSFICNGTSFQVSEAITGNVATVRISWNKHSLELSRALE